MITEIKRRRNLNIFDYKELAKPLKMFCFDSLPEGNLYGLSHNLIRYTGNQKKRDSIASYIEHGLFLGSVIPEATFKYDLKRVLTFGRYRKEILSADMNLTKDIVEIGPYIHYCGSLLSDEDLSNLKDSLGKVLVVFPSHSIEGMTTSFDNESLINEINRIKVIQQIDTVIVCMYWKDILTSKINRSYENEGYKIVCSGHRNDIYFMNRLRSIIALSDYTMSNEVGTHLGYCIYMKKPHYVYEQKVDFEEDLNEILKTENMLEEEFNHQKKQLLTIASYFNVFGDFITEKQIEIVDYYWGLNNVKTQDEMKFLLKQNN